MSRFIAACFALLVIGCAHAAPVATTPAPSPASAPPRAVPAPAAVAPDVPPDTDRVGLPGNWHLLDEQNDHIAGVSSERAMKELLAGRQPKRTVIVAVIDGGVDTSHADLRANLWDQRGWNFIGGKDGKDVWHDTFEFTRVYATCKKRAPTGDFSKLPPADVSMCSRARSDYEKQRAEMENALPGIQQADQVLTTVQNTLKTAMKTDSLSEQAVAMLDATTPELTRAKQVFLQLAAQGITRTEIDRAKEEVTNRLKYGLDLEYNSRTIVGDDTTNIMQKDYGNKDITGPDASHGTHVAGIIGAVRGNNLGVDGIAPAVKIMAVRAVPDGDERDKDIANAIRYAVDNGANVINMSFGKGFSPGKAAVDAAVKYADAHGVLMVHAAGNDGANIDSTESYPTPRYLDGGRPQNWIEVGASSWKGGKDLAAEFSNYGMQKVDLFAPGVDILSTVPGGKYEKDSGTSMASPVTAGVAALVMAYYPELSASDIKKILVNSATRHNTQLVNKPGDAKGAVVPFGMLSASGGIVNAYAALKMAEQMTHRQ